MCLTSLKKVCRTYGIVRWPYRRLKMIDRVSLLHIAFFLCCLQRVFTATGSLPLCTPEGRLFPAHLAELLGLMLAV